MITNLLLVGLCFLIGQISAGKVIARSRGVDLSKHGSGNVGATNVSRVFGLKLGLITLLFDVFKGFLPYFLSTLVPDSNWILPLTGFSVVLGHCFAGGKGVATTLGVLLALSYQLALAALASFIITFSICRIVSASSIVAAIIIPIAGSLLGLNSPALISLLAISILVIFRHRSNIERLLRGEEKRFSAGR